MWATVVSYLAKGLLDWLWPKLLSWVSNLIGAASENRAFNKAKNKLEEANEKVKDQIDKAALATATRAERMGAARANSKRS